MERKPDIIRAIVVVFVLGLAITGITTSLQASEERSPAIEEAAGLFSVTED